MYSWIASMRRKPIEERRRFVASLVIFIMALITVIWFLLFFSGISERLKSPEADVLPEEMPASVIEGALKPESPFSGN